MYTKISDFLTDYKNESEATLKIFNALDNNSLNIKLNGYNRTLGKIAWHITLMLPEMGETFNLPLKSMIKDAPQPETIEAIISTYKLASEELAELIKNSWTDASLTEVKTVYGQTFSNQTGLNMLVKHEIHHRGQLTVLMRLAGLKVPGIYGPAKEEWSALGMPEVE